MAMVTEIIDLLVDASNTFGSLYSYLRMKFKNYGVVINSQVPIELDRVEQLYFVFPKLRSEIDIYIQQVLYVVVDNYSFKNGKGTLIVALLDENYKIVHGFTMLQKNAIVSDLRIPCYWKI